MRRAVFTRVFIITIHAAEPVVLLSTVFKLCLLHICGLSERLVSPGIVNTRVSHSSMPHYMRVESCFRFYIESSKAIK